MRNRKVYIVRKRNSQKRALLNKLIQSQSQTLEQSQLQLQSQNQLQNQLQAQVQHQTQVQTQVQSQLQEQAQKQLQLQAQAQAQAQLQLQLLAQIQEQFQIQSQLQAQLLTRTQDLTDIGNPVVTVDTEDASVVKASAFRAIINNPVNVAVPLFSEFKVFFPAEEFDLNGEFNPVTSTFTPSSSGAYYITSTIGFIHRTEPVTIISSIFMDFKVNGQFVNIDTDTRLNLANQGIGQVTQLTDILELNAGDTVEVFVTGELLGELNGTLFSGSFAAARQPSP
ncbi:hypothetical protein [Paenibacillus sp. FSL R10-2734]|uniref:hypothetical protein n=1 Tax=Paenibacillus sp. FSL R10-2734 TaxID=2954691 RepID=UPI0030D9CAC7